MFVGCVSWSLAFPGLLFFAFLFSWVWRCCGARTLRIDGYFVLFGICCRRWIFVYLSFAHLVFAVQYLFVSGVAVLSLEKTLMR